MTEIEGPALPAQAIIDTFVLASHGNLAEVEATLAEHPTVVHGRAVWDETPLGAAAHVGNETIARRLLAAGAPPEMCAFAMLGDRAMVERLIAAEPALADARGPHNIGVVCHAVLRGHRDIAEYLLARGADVNVGAGATTALHAAIHFGDPSTVAWLLASGADAQANDYHGKTALELAVEQGKTEVAEVLRAHMSA